MPRVDFDLYVEQDEKTSRLMLHVNGDPPVAIVEYDRALAEKTSRLSFIKIDGDGSCGADEHIGVRISFAKDPCE